MPPFPSIPSWPGSRLVAGAVVRGAALWLLVRVLVGVVPGSLWPTLVILAVTLVAAMAETRRQRMHVFLANLGVPVWMVTAFWLLPSVLLELSLLLSGVEIDSLIVLLAGQP